MVAYCPNLVQGSQLMAGRQALGALQDLSVGHPVMEFLDLFLTQQPARVGRHKHE